MAKRPSGLKSMTSIFNTSWENAKMHICRKFGDSNSNQLQVIVRTNQLFLKFWVRMAKVTSKVKVNDLLFQPRWPQAACLMQICWFQPKSGMSYHADKRILSNSEPNCQNDLECQGQRHRLSISAGSIPWCMFGANLLIPAQICDELSCGQGKIFGRADRQTDRQTQATTIPFDLKEHGVKWTAWEGGYFLLKLEYHSSENLLRFTSNKTLISSA